MTALADCVTSLVTGVALFLIGRWGGRNAATLVPDAMPEPDREHRVRVLRRGAIACQCVAVLFVVAGPIALLR